MKAWFRSCFKSKSASDHVGADEVRDRLALPELRVREMAPDLTEPIMTQLGFVRSDVASERSRSRRRTALRTVAALTCILTMVGALSVQMHSIRVQRASQPSINRAIPDVARSGANAVNDFSRAVRTLITPADWQGWDPSSASDENGAASDPASRSPLDSVAPSTGCSRVRWSGLL
ncbi:MAG: hypothetical protein ACR2GY_03480 [Phycisphaerales bacterium]